MGYYLYDVEGYVADFGSAGGFSALSPFLERAGPASLEFVDLGATERLEELRVELAGIKDVSDPDVQSSLSALIAAVGVAKEIIILSDGFG